MGGGSAEKKLRPQRLPFTISSPLAVLLDNTTGVNDTKESKISAGLAGVEIAKNISNAIKKAVQSLSLIVNGTVFVLDKQSLNVSEPERSCDTGQAYRNGFCCK